MGARLLHFELRSMINCLIFHNAWTMTRVLHQL